jgi:hypothetical protein
VAIISFLINSIGFYFGGQTKTNIRLAEIYLR